MLTLDKKLSLVDTVLVEVYNFITNTSHAWEWTDAVELVDLIGGLVL